MLFHTIAFSAILLGAAHANVLNERFVDDGFNALTKRQQFEPTTQTATGSTCADAFGGGYVTCRDTTATQNRLCYNPQVGQTCCEATWACPNGSFCLSEPYCCPNGEDPKACAADNNVVLPSSYVTPSAKPTTTTNATSAIYPSTTASSSIYTTPIASASSYIVPYPVYNATHKLIQPSASGTGAYYVSPSTFPGAASNIGISLVGLAGAGLLSAIAALF